MGEHAQLKRDISGETSLGNTVNASLNAQYELYLKCIQTPVLAIDSEFNLNFGKF